MPADIRDLSTTIIPKSDQLNADQLVGGPLVITITDVTVSKSTEQPVSIFHDMDPARPYKPCMTMRKVLILAWGKDGSQWTGKSMELFNEPSVKFGAEVVGGIRISRLSDIPAEIKVSLVATKGKKAMHVIKPLELSGALQEVLADIAAAEGKAGLERAKAKAKELKSPADMELALAAYKKRVEALKEKAAASSTPTDRPDKGAESTEHDGPQREEGSEHPSAAGQAGQEGDQTGAPVRTYASVAAALSAASTREALDEAALLIDAVAAAKHRTELVTIYKQRVEELEG